MSALELEQTLTALREARDALANAIAWLDDMHTTTSRAERRRMYAAAHSSVCSEIVRVTGLVLRGEP